MVRPVGAGVKKEDLNDFCRAEEKRADVFIIPQTELQLMYRVLQRTKTCKRTKGCWGRLLARGYSTTPRSETSYFPSYIQIRRAPTKGMLLAIGYIDELGVDVAS